MPSPTAGRSLPALRLAVLAVSVLDDIDVRPTEQGVAVEADGGEHHLTWLAIAQILGSDPDDPTARARLSRTLRLHRWALRHGRQADREIRAAARLMAIPVDSGLHPGARWTVDRVLGGALECGIGLVLEDDEHADLSTPLPPSLADAVGIDPDELYPGLRRHAATMGALAVSRLVRDTRGARPTGISATDGQAVLRPVGGLDVPSLLATHEVRRFLASSDGSGLRAIAVPNRRRGWYDLARIDPAFVQAAWAASEEWERGLPRPLLVTEDEVAVGPVAGDVIRLSLEDAAVERRGMRHNILFT